MKANVVVLENSTNQHKLESNSSIIVEDLNELGGKYIQTEGNDGIVTHAEHGTLKIKGNHLVKVTQQEQNPITGLMQNAYD